MNNWTMESVVSLCVLLLLRVSDLQYDLAGIVWYACKHPLRLARLRKRQDGAHTRCDSARVKQCCECLQARVSHFRVEENGPFWERLRGD